MQTTRRKVIIVGGGFGGLEAAKALGSSDVDVVVVDRRNYHLFQPLLYQVAMAGLSPAEIASPIRGILAEQANARVMMGEVTHVDLAARRIQVGAEQLGYDWLVLAVGAKTGYFGHDEWEKNAPGLKHIEDALEIRRRVLLAFERAEREPDERERRKLLTFVVIGGGPTGVEMAGAIAELSRYVLGKDFRSIDPREARVVLIEAGPRILPSFAESLAQSAVEQLQELGAEVRTGTRVVTIDEGGAEVEGSASADQVPGLGSGRVRTRIESPTVVWAAGVAANALAQKLGVPTDRQGRVIVGHDCALPGHPEVFAIGDMARFEQNGQVLPGVSPVAMQQARYVAKLVRWELESKGAPPREPFKYFDKGSMATIGRSRAIAEARGIKMHGFIAWLAWLFIHIWYLIGFRNRLAVLLNWTWSYVSYKRGARLITSTGWHPDLGPVSMTSSPPAGQPAALPKMRPSNPPPAPAPREAVRGPGTARPSDGVATPTS
ncbi:MAG: FAD-dependent pyridine nucleotide-disulfide oxidoreductase [Labilithrix sp.]|nr:FAD-dependent pyridine nucleotide-disulfide oxidoreductase [Labilithrix sp.]